MNPYSSRLRHTTTYYILRHTRATTSFIRQHTIKTLKLGSNLPTYLLTTSHIYIMVKAELKNWWREQTVHPSRMYPSMPVCRCAACFNGTAPGQEVFRDPIDPRELPFKQDKRANKTTTFFANAEKPKEVRAKLVKKSWYRQQQQTLARKPSRESVASETSPLYAVSKAQRDSAETLVPTQD